VETGNKGVACKESQKRRCLPHFISTGYNFKRGGNYRLNQIENDGNMVKTSGTSELDELIDSLTLFDDDLMTLARIAEGRATTAAWSM
jgi:hypothetical protein